MTESGRLPALYGDACAQTELLTNVDQCVEGKQIQSSAHQVRDAGLGNAAQRGRAGLRELSMAHLFDHRASHLGPELKARGDFA